MPLENDWTAGAVPDHDAALDIGPESGGSIHFVIRVASGHERKFERCPFRVLCGRQYTQLSESGAGREFTLKNSNPARSA
jgi:hypothetical protein